MSDRVTVTMPPHLRPDRVLYIPFADEEAVRYYMVLHPDGRADVPPEMAHYDQGTIEQIARVWLGP